MHSHGHDRCNHHDAACKSLVVRLVLFTANESVTLRRAVKQHFRELSRIVIAVAAFDELIK